MAAHVSPRTARNHGLSLEPPGRLLAFSGSICPPTVDHRSHCAQLGALGPDGARSLRFRQRPDRGGTGSGQRGDHQFDSATPSTGSDLHCVGDRPFAGEASAKTVSGSHRLLRVRRKSRRVPGSAWVRIRRLHHQWAALGQHEAARSGSDHGRSGRGPETGREILWLWVPSRELVPVFPPIPPAPAGPVLPRPGQPGHLAQPAPRVRLLLRLGEMTLGAPAFQPAPGPGRKASFHSLSTQLRIIV